MALLNLSVTADKKTAADGNNHMAVLAITVCDMAGIGISNLDAANNFKVDILSMPDGAAKFTLYAMLKGAFAGSYRINLYPPGNKKWKKGTYTCTLKVQTLPLATGNSGFATFKLTI